MATSANRSRYREGTGQAGQLLVAHAISGRGQRHFDDFELAVGVVGAQHLLVELADRGLRDGVDEAPPFG